MTNSDTYDNLRSVFESLIPLSDQEWALLGGAFTERVVDSRTSGKFHQAATQHTSVKRAYLYASKLVHFSDDPSGVPVLMVEWSMLLCSPKRQCHKQRDGR
jgi:hypothetical protein